jgi:hypothetical protein
MYIHKYEIANDVKLKISLNIHIFIYVFICVLFVPIIRVYAHEKIIIIEEAARTT